VIRHQDVDRSELFDGEVDDTARCSGISEVGLDAPESITLASEGLDHRLHTGRIGAPWLLGIVRRPGLQDNAGAFSEHALCYGEADSRLPTYAGDERNSPR
jgi:hypothetical protein